MNDETNVNLLGDLVKKQSNENDSFRNKDLSKMIGIFLIVFIILAIYMVSIVP